MKKMTVALFLSLLTLGAWANGSQEAASKPIVAVWYPNNSGEDWKTLRVGFDQLVTKATGRPVVDKLTTDYVIAIEALATGNAAIGYPGALGFIQAQLKNPRVQPWSWPRAIPAPSTTRPTTAASWSRLKTPPPTNRAPATP